MPRTIRQPATARAYSPDNCPNNCRGRKGGQAWSLAKDAIPPTEHQHHPVCQYARAWNATLSLPETTSVLYDLELGRVARSAMPEEIAEADAAERTTTMRNITVAGRLFAVLNRGDADLAEREARGEEPELPPMRPIPAVVKAPTAEQLQLRATAGRPISAAPSEPDGIDAPVPEPEQDAEPEPLNAAELRSMLDSPYAPGAAVDDEPDPNAEAEPELDPEPEPVELRTAEDVARYFGEPDPELEGDEHDAPTEPAPPLVLIEEPSEPELASAAEEEREDWPELSELQGGPEAYRQRAEVTANRYLARSPGRTPPQSPHT